MPPASQPFLAWPILLGAASLAFPALVAVGRRLSLLHDPAGQIAGAWLVVGAINLAGLGQVLGILPRGVPAGAIANGLAALLLMPALLTWIGAGARRWRARLQVGVAAAWLLGMLVLGPGREFRVVAAPLMGALMTALASAALAQTVRTRHRAPDLAPRQLILTALVTYFLVGILAKPLIETMVRTTPEAVLHVHMGGQLLMAGCMTVVAWGILRSPKRPSPASASSADSTRASVPSLAPPVTVPAGAYPEPQRPAARQAV